MFRSTASFDRMLERATSNLLLEPDWNAILQICDSIRYHSYIKSAQTELVSKELNHLAAILHVYAGGLNFMK